MRFANALIENREVNKELPSLVKKVIEDYLLNQLDKEASDDIRSKIDEQLTNINLGEFVDGISVNLAAVYSGCLQNLQKSCGSGCQLY